MSSLEQMQDNVNTFSSPLPLSGDETALLLEIAEGMKDAIPCTACRYCCAGCPMGLDIPMLISIYNELRFSPSITSAMAVEAQPEDKRPPACIGCGSCARMCPQGIDIPRHMRDMSGLLSTIPSWTDICRQREAAAKNSQ